jgi:hypothetical protein
LLIALIATSALHYENVSGRVLLHEISQRLYYLPIINAAYRYGLRGGLTVSLVSVVTPDSRFRDHPTRLGYFIPEAPHLAVTSDARSGRRLMAEHQVKSASRHLTAKHAASCRAHSYRREFQNH